jgi:hypothetical protein
LPDSRKHRGADPHDDQAFEPAAIPALRKAVADLSWLLSHGYAIASALKLVGDRWSLTERQRQAIRRAACTDEARVDRRRRRIEPDMMIGRSVEVDGFNVLTTIEAALGGAVVLKCRDETFRDLAGVHGTYRKVAETIPALLLAGETLEAMNVSEVHWLFDRPVSNSGRILSVLGEIAIGKHWPWTVELVDNPDARLKVASRVVATADSAVLDRCEYWFNLARCIVEGRCPGARIVELSE